jgi:hypothetical protein
VKPEDRDALAVFEQKLQRTQNQLANAEFVMHATAREHDVATRVAVAISLLSKDATYQQVAMAAQTAAALARLDAASTAEKQAETALGEYNASVDAYNAALFAFRAKDGES